MSSLFWVILVILSYSFFDLFVKLSSDKISDGFGSLIINTTAALIALGYVVYSYFKGDPILVTKAWGIQYSVIAGVIIGLGTILFIKMFSSGINLSLATPLVKIGLVIVTSTLGILLLKEHASWQYFFGVAISLLGLFFVVTAK